MKRKLMIAGLVVVCILAGGLLVLQIWIGSSVKQNIKLAQQKYHGTAEDALISYMIDENISPEGRTHEAIWTLGQIRSEKALPYLMELYKDDPKGKTCYGKHGKMLCQYEIHKAIVAIERRGLISYARLNK
ncbi:MAG: HEAT repeat domain-containing protein [Bacteroidales bacterium]|nr:HEAT repeat domain-containing protein [Bacteroidales bacterium]